MLSIFGSSGFRGVFGYDLKPELITKISWAFTSLGKNSVVIGWDTRLSSPLLALSAAIGVVEAGGLAKLAGMMPTPALAYISRNDDAGIMITASHNPPEYNGIKLFDSDSSSLTPIQYSLVEQRMALYSSAYDWRNLGLVAFSSNLLESYVSSLLNEGPLMQRAIAVDPGGGALCELASNVLKQLGCHVKAINDKPDGLFKARPSEPSPEALRQLSECIKDHSLSCGFAFDGDGDRVVVVDENGRVTQPDSLIAAYASYVVERSRNKVVVVNLDTSFCVDLAVEKAGGKVVRTKVGDVFITEQLKQLHGVFGAEPCGAWIHPDFSLCPDGLLSTVRLLKVLDEVKEPVSSFCSKYSPGIMLRDKVSCENKLKSDVMQKVRVYADNIKYSKMETIDGIWLRLEDYSWMLIRPSGTEPYIRISVEAKDHKLAKDLLEKAKDIVKKSIEAVRQ